MKNICRDLDATSPYVIKTCLTFANRHALFSNKSIKILILKEAIIEEKSESFSIACDLETLENLPDYVKLCKRDLKKLEAHRKFLQGLFYECRDKMIKWEEEIEKEKE